MQKKKLIDILGFTRTEFNVIAFLLGILALGLLVRYFSLERAVPRAFDYTKADSIFLSVIKDTADFEGGAAVDTVKARVLDLQSAPAAGKEPPPELNSVDINSADLKVLCSLPGIGSKTAANIIEFRSAAGGFRSVKDLLEVKGIGPSKFSKIEKYLCLTKKSGRENKTNQLE